MYQLSLCDGTACMYRLYMRQIGAVKLVGEISSDVSFVIDVVIVMQISIILIFLNSIELESQTQYINICACCVTDAHVDGTRHYKALS